MQTAGPIWTKFATRMQIHRRNVGVRGHTFQNVGNMPNSWTDRDQIWHLYTDSSGNGHELDKLTLRSRP